MADYIQIGNLVSDNLESAAHIEWLENLSDEMNRCFVEVTDGDASHARAIDVNEVLTIDELMKSDYARGSYIAVDADLTDDADIKKLESIRERAKAKLGFGMAYFCPVED